MAIDYNKSVLPLYADLDQDAEFTQELATQSSRAYDETDVSIGLTGEQIILNTVAVTVTGTVPVSGDASLDDWLTAILASTPVTGGDIEASILTQQDGGKVLVLVAVDQGGSTVDITTAAGTPDGLPSLGMPATTVISGGDLGLGRADQKNEQRILTTLGVLTAHLRLLGTRAESRNLHFVMSRIATAVGSGGFVYNDKVTSVVGNRKNPVFIVGDTIRIEAISEGEDATKIDTGSIALSTGTSLDDAIIDINAGIAGGTISGDAEGLEAINDGGYLKLESRNGWSIFVNGFGAADIAVPNKAGLEIDHTTQNAISAVASRVETEALAYFNTNRRKLNM